MKKIFIKFTNKKDQVQLFFSGLPKWKKVSMIFSILTLIVIALGLALVLYDKKGHLDVFAIYKYRLPKLPLIFIMGIGASVSALLLQKITKNRLADMGLIGLSDSGIFMLSILTVYSPALTNSINNPVLFSIVIPLVIAGTSLLTISLLYLLSIKRGVSPRRVILMGIGVHVFFVGASSLMIYLNNGYEMNFFLRYMTGFIETKPFIVWLISGSVIIFCLIISIPLWNKMDILESSEDIAHSVGVRKELIKFLVFIIASLMIGATTAVVGSVALLGILAPNLARSFFGNKMSFLVPGSMLIGVITVMIAQFININLFHIAAPIGILVQLVIAPYFLFRVFRKGGE